MVDRSRLDDSRRDVAIHRCPADRPLGGEDPLARRPGRLRNGGERLRLPVGRWLCGFACPIANLNRLSEWFRWRTHKRLGRWLGTGVMLLSCLLLATVTFSLWVGLMTAPVLLAVAFIPRFLERSSWKGRRALLGLALVFFGVLAVVRAASTAECAAPERCATAAVRE